jgi:hypothetical protein
MRDPRAVSGPCRTEKTGLCRRVERGRL